MNRATEASTSPWRTELRATLALAWPLMLSNITMAFIQATDVVLMGWLGARPLAASALGLNLTFAFSLICLGLVTASSPMMATALGARLRSVHDVRRTRSEERRVGKEGRAGGTAAHENEKVRTGRRCIR